MQLFEKGASSIILLAFKFSVCQVHLPTASTVTITEGFFLAPEPVHTQDRPEVLENYYPLAGALN